MAEASGTQGTYDLLEEQERLAERRGLQSSGDAASTSQRRGRTETQTSGHQSTPDEYKQGGLGMGTGTEQDAASMVATFQSETPERGRPQSSSREAYEPEVLRPQAEASRSGNGDYSPDDEEADALAALAAAAREDVVGQLPRYAAPSLSSCLPAYRNEEQEFILRTFAGGNYDMLRHLPDSIREQQVLASRSARQEASRAFLLPGLVGSQLRLRSNPPNQQGLFTAFEYIPSRYSLAAELASKERVAAEATRLTIGRGREFLPVVAPLLQKQHEIGPKEGYVYLAGPHEDTEDLRQSARFHTAAGIVNPPFLPAGTQKLGAEAPTRLAALEMMKSLKRALEADWEGAVISLFENEHDCWVICFQEASVDGGVEGLTAYMNVFVRTNPLATEYRLTKVVEYWSTCPGDGCAYFVLRPPWVAAQRLDTFFALHPEERDWRTSFPVAEMEAERRARRKALDAGDDELEVEQRMRQMSIRSRHSINPHSPAAAAASATASQSSPSSLLPPLPSLPPHQQPQNPPPLHLPLPLPSQQQQQQQQPSSAGGAGAQVPAAAPASAPPPPGTSASASSLPASGAPSAPASLHSGRSRGLAASAASLQGGL